MRRLLLLVIAGLALVACSSKTAPVRLVSGCDGPDGSCARYVQGVDSEGAPVARATLIVPFSAPIRLADRPAGLSAVTASVNLESRRPELKLVPVASLRIDPQSPRQLIADLDGLLADGAAIDLPDGALLDDRGKSIGPLTVKFNTGLTPFAVALAAVQWRPTDTTLFSADGLQAPHGRTDEASVREELEARLRIRPGITDEQVNSILARYDGDALKRKAPDHRVRAGLLLLTGTSAEYAIDFIQSDTNRRGVPFEPIQLDSLQELGALAAVFYHPLLGRLQMYIDTQMAEDSLEGIAVLIAHEALHSSLGGGSATEETLAMAANTRVYEELLLFDPAIAQVPSEVIRAQNRLTLALRNSGRFSYPRAGILPRPGVEDALRGAGTEPARSLKDLLFKPDFYGEIAKTGDIGTEVIEAYYQRIAGSSESQGRLGFDQTTVKLFDKVMDNGFTDDQILAIADALKLKPVPIEK